MSGVLTEIYDGIRGELLRTVGRSRFRLWFRDAAVVDVGERGVTLAVPSDVHRTWLRYTYGDLLREACERVLGAGVAIHVEVSGEQDRCRRLRDRLPDRPEAWEALIAKRRGTPSLETFVARGPGRLAVMVLRQLLVGGGAHAAPCYTLHGPCGSGKTQLLAGLASDVRRRQPADVLMLSARRFTQRYVTALRTREVDALRAFEVDLQGRRLVLLDGVDQLEPRPATQRALERLLEGAGLGGTRFVFASRRHPAEVEGLSARLRSRLLGGVMLALEAPGRGLLGTILEERSLGMGAVLPEDVREAILDRTGSVRGAVGLLERWAAASAELGRALEVAWLPELAPAVTGTAREEVIRRAKLVVADHFGIRPALLDRPTKVRSARFPRRVAMYLVYRACALPLAELGTAFGLRSHSSVSRAIGEMRVGRQTDAALEQLVDGLLARL